MSFFDPVRNQVSKQYSRTSAALDGEGIITVLSFYPVKKIVLNSYSSWKVTKFYTNL